MDRETARDLTPCCGFARLAQAGDTYAQGIRVWFTDTGRMVCERCVRGILAVADDELELRRRREGKPRNG